MFNGILKNVVCVFCLLKTLVYDWISITGLFNMGWEQIEKSKWRQNWNIVLIIQCSVLHSNGACLARTQNNMSIQPKDTRKLQNKSHCNDKKITFEYSGTAGALIFCTTINICSFFSSIPENLYIAKPCLYSLLHRGLNNDNRKHILTRKW